MTVPNEDDISKTQLWQRIDDALASINLIGKNIQDTMVSTVDALKATNDTSLKDFATSLQMAISVANADISGKKKDLEAINNDAHTKMVSDFQQYEKTIDDRFADLSKTVQEETANSLSDSFAKISEAMSTLNDMIKQYQFDMHKQVSTLQIEMGTKLGDVTAKFTEMKTKFQKISEQLQ